MKTTQSYPETHLDHITSFLPLRNINPYHVLCTSGDCLLSIFDLRKPSALVTSEDQEDELLCSTFADDSRRICVGTQSGFITLWKSGQWMDHVDRIAPAGKLRKGDEASSIDCMVQLEDQIIVGASDGSIRTVGFRPNRYEGVIAHCEDGVTSLAVVPKQERWIVSASGSKITFWDTNEHQNDGVDDNNGSSSEEEKPKKKRKKSANNKNRGSTSTFFADLE